MPAQPPPFPCGSFVRNCSAWAAMLLLLLSAGLSTAFAQNILNDPGFEQGGANWSASFIYGATGSVVTNAAAAHSGNCYYTTTGAGGNIASVGEGDSSGPYPTGTNSFPIIATDYYQLSAWVKVPGASTTPQQVTLRYRFEPSDNRNNTGTQTINTENWTHLTSPWIQPAGLAGGSGDTYLGYWVVNSLNNGITMDVDDCAMIQAAPYTITGQVVDGSNTGQDGVTVSGSFGTYTASAITAGGGYYSLSIPPANGTWTLSGIDPGYLGSVSVAVSSVSNTAPNIVLNTDPNYDTNLLFSIHSSDYAAGSGWPCVEPNGVNLVNFSGTPGTTLINGQNWELNHHTTADAFQFPGPGVGGQFTDPIPVNGATIVAAVRPIRSPVNDAWDSVVDIMYNRLCLLVNNSTGTLQVWLNGTLTSGPVLPNGQIVILSVVVQPDGSYNVYTNDNPTPVITVASDVSGIGMTTLDPTWNGGGLGYWSYITVGKNYPDPWPCFNGNIGDTSVYKIALDDTTRSNLVSNLMAKFGTAPIYTITATGGANGSITPSGTVSVPVGLNQAFTITPAAGYVQAVTVDGVSQGAITSYTFSNVTSNHTIDAAFTLLPPQNVSGTVTNSSGAGIPNATVYFSTSTNASASPIFTVVTDGSGNYTQALYNATWYASASAATNLPSGDITFTTAGVPLTGENIGLVTGSGLNVPQQANLLYSALAANCQGTNAPWPTFMPNGLSLTAIGTPSTVTDGNNIAWENNAEEGDGFRFFKGIYGPPSTTIPMNGGTIVVVCQPNVGAYGANAFQGLVSCFENNFSICVDRSTGDVSIGVQAGSAGPNINTGVILNGGQSYVLSLVVQPGGGGTLYVNGAQAWTGSTPTLTSITPQAFYNVDLNIGMCWEGDSWSSFIGLIGDAFVYNTPLNATDRTALENSLFTKFDVTPAPHYNWAGTDNGNWSDLANWSNAVPAVGDLATFSQDSSAGATVQLDTPVSVLGIDFNNLVPTTTIASSAGYTLTFDDGSGLYSSIAPITVDGGSNTISAAVEALAGIGLNGPGELKLTGSTDIGLDSAVNPALVVQGGGTLELAGPTTLDLTRNTGVHGGGTLIISGAFTSSDADQKIGDDFGAGPGYVVLKGTGSWTHTGTGGFDIGVLQYPGTVTINDNATLDLSGQDSGYGFISVALGYGGGSTGTVIQNGGTVKTEVVGTAWNGPGGPGVILGNWVNAPCTAEYDLNGGTLITPNIYNVNSSGGVLVAPNGSALFRFNGGVLQGTQNDNQGDPQVVAEGSTNLMGNLTHAYVETGGAKINTVTFNCGINQSLEHDPALGATLDGGLTVQGSGTLTLYQASTYTGPTKVQGGVLACAMNSALGSGSLDISTGASVALNYTGTQSISQLTFNGGVPQPNGTYGATGSGATTIDNTHFSGTGTVTVAPSSPPTPVLPLAGFTRPGGVPTFTFNTVSGYKYQMVYKNNLTDATWTVVPPGYVTSTGAPMTVQDTTAAGQPHRFYLLETANP